MTHNPAGRAVSPGRLSASGALVWRHEHPRGSSRNLPSVVQDLVERLRAEDHPDAPGSRLPSPGGRLITELALSGMPGVRLLDEVAIRYPQLRTVALATVDAPRTLDDTLVLVKPFSHTRLLRTVERVMQVGDHVP